MTCHRLTLDTVAFAAKAGENGGHKPSPKLSAVLFDRPGCQTPCPSHKPGKSPHRARFAFRALPLLLFAALIIAAFAQTYQAARQLQTQLKQEQSK